MHYPIQTLATAPKAARTALDDAQRSYGFIPNMLGAMATAPTLLSAYTALAAIFENSSLTATERQTVLLTASVENYCAYCMAAQSTIATIQRVPIEVIEALHCGAPLPNDQLEALRQFARAMVITRGMPTRAQTAAFLGAGYGPQQVLEIVLGVSLTTLCSYANHIAATPLDVAFTDFAWAPTAKNEADDQRRA